MPLLLNRKKSRQNEEYLAHLNNMEVFTALTESLGLTNGRNDLLPLPA
jgi:hypothetical protein